ncbi:MAG TPA: hypothetical protein VM490_11970 [Armatimonadaceae bacterium]|nr:hypothetical protein [Armatimonadaceae bacterium]
MSAPSSGRYSFSSLTTSDSKKAADSTAARYCSAYTESPAWSSTPSRPASSAASSGSPGATHAQTSERMGQPMPLT